MLSSPQNTPNGGLYKTTNGGYNWDLLAFADTEFFMLAVRQTKVEIMMKYLLVVTLNISYIIKILPGLGIVRLNSTEVYPGKVMMKALIGKLNRLAITLNLNSLCILKNNNLYTYSVGDEATLLRSNC